MNRLANTFIKNCIFSNTFAGLKISVMTVLMLLSPAGQFFSALFFIFCDKNSFSLLHQAMNVAESQSSDFLSLFLNLDPHMKKA